MFFSGDYVRRTNLDFVKGRAQRRRKVGLAIEQAEDVVD
jgi:hypothetical protein